MEIIAVALIVIGIFFVIRGLTERMEILPHEEYTYHDRLKRRYDYDEEMEEEFKPKKKVKAGGVVLIGPIPIVFGESRYAVYALILAIILMLLSLLLMFSANL
ncbi:TIGR00304 family protein [Archaeoglobales archaeon]|mgnify:CR=1 FL=1|nr:MAG: TIGR00304 family protein [Archaeoglobales archaeon]